MMINNKLLKKGDMLTIKKGSLVKSMHPSKQEYKLSRSQNIKVDHWYDLDDHVVWAGSGGYWCWTNFNNIKLE